MHLELSKEERAILEQIIERALSEMRVEVRRTSTPRYQAPGAHQSARLLTESACDPAGRGLAVAWPTEPAASDC
jgi:hypothetical protein